MSLAYDWSCAILANAAVDKAWPERDARGKKTGRTERARVSKGKNACSYPSRVWGGTMTDTAERCLAGPLSGTWDHVEGRSGMAAINGRRLASFLRKIDREDKNRPEFYGLCHIHAALQGVAA